MKNKVFYWCPFIDKVATVRSVLNSSFSISKYHNSIEPVILDVCGEWKPYIKEIKENNIQTEYLTNHNILPIKNNKRGFLFSRILYLKIILKSFFPLLNFLKKNNNNYIIIHLLTSLPLLLNIILKQKSRMILRISGLPKLNFFRKLLWSISLKELHKVFCPTEDTKNYLEEVFPKFKTKFEVLRDPVINVKKIQKLINEENKNIYTSKEYFISIGRFTKQKNYLFLLKFLKFYFKNKKPNYNFLLIGEGEDKMELSNYIEENNLNNFVKIYDYQKNIFPLLKKAKALLSTSLWEDPGFTLIESGYVNTSVISSDCPNGPREILDNGKNGYIFKSNSIESLKKTFDEFLNEEPNLIKLKKIKLKKHLKKYTLFNHFNILKRVFDEIK